MSDRAHLLTVGGVFIVAPLLAVIYAALGMKGLSVALGLSLAIYALVRPKSGIWLASGFLVFCTQLFHRNPIAGVGHYPWEYYYWALGLALITGALGIAFAFSRLGDRGRLRNLLRTPTSRTMFLFSGIVLASTVWAIVAGNEPSFILRQVYGAILLFFFYLATLRFFLFPDLLHWLWSRLRWLVVVGAAYYSFRATLVLSGILSSAGWGGDGYYRAPSPFSYYAGAVAVWAFYDLIHPAAKRRRLWIAVQFAICASSVILYGARGVAVSMAAAISLLFLWLLRRRPATLLAASGLLILAMGLAGVAESLTETSTTVAAIAKRFSYDPEDSSAQHRIAQLKEIVRRTNEYPALGIGIGGTLAMYTEAYGQFVEYNYVDHGWGYVLLKFGWLGFFSFVALTLACIGSMLKVLDEKSPHLELSRGLFFMYLYWLVQFVFAPSFLHFTAAGFIGTLLASLTIMSCRTSALPARVSAPTGAPARVPEVAEAALG